MMPRLLFVMIILLPVLACAQQNSIPPSPPVSDPDASVSSPPMMPVVTDTGDTVTIPKPQQDPSCIKPLDLIGQSHEIFQRVKFKYTVRVLWPDTPATMDYSPTRTNFILDKQGIIREIRCG